MDSLQRVGWNILTLTFLAASPSWAQNCLDAEDGDPMCAVFVDAEGNVGVGTTVPLALLDVQGAVFFEGGDGDVNSSGIVNVTDLGLILRHLDGTIPFSPDEYALADINGDGRVSWDDVGLWILLFQRVPKDEAVHRIESGYGMINEGVFYVDGNVGIGTSSPFGALDVNGSIFQRGGLLHADYVFEPGYELESIEEHAEYMSREKHLKAVPRRQVDDEGREVLEMGAHRRGILEELEKAHLYVVQLNQMQERMLGQIDDLRAKVAKLESALDATLIAGHKKGHPLVIPETPVNPKKTVLPKVGSAFRRI